MLNVKSCFFISYKIMIVSLTIWFIQRYGICIKVLFLLFGEVSLLILMNVLLGFKFSSKIFFLGKVSILYLSCACMMITSAGWLGKFNNFALGERVFSVYVRMYAINDPAITLAAMLGPNASNFKEAASTLREVYGSESAQLRYFEKQIHSTSPPLVL